MVAAIVVAAIALRPDPPVVPRITVIAIPGLATPVAPRRPAPAPAPPPPPEPAPPPAALPREPWAGLAVSPSGATIVVWTRTQAFASRDDGRTFAQIAEGARDLQTALVGEDGAIYLLDAPQALGVVRAGEPIRWRDIPFAFNGGAWITLVGGWVVAMGVPLAAPPPCIEQVARSIDQGATWQIVDPPPAPRSCPHGSGRTNAYAWGGTVIASTELASPPRFFTLAPSWTGWTELPYGKLYHPGSGAELRQDGWFYSWQRDGLHAMAPSGEDHVLTGIDHAIDPFLWSMLPLRNDRAAFLIFHRDGREHLFELDGDAAHAVALPREGAIGAPYILESQIALDQRGRLTALAAGHVVRWTHRDGWQPVPGDAAVTAARR